MEITETKAHAQALIQSNRHLDALEYLESSLQLSAPNSPQRQSLGQDLSDLCNSVAMSFLSKGDLASSFNLLKRAESLCEKYTETRAAVYNNFACYYRRIGKARVALAYLDKAREAEKRLRAGQSIANTHLNYCAVLSELGRHEGALRHIMMAVILLQDDLAHVYLADQTPSEDKCEVLSVAYHNYAVELEFQKEVIPPQYLEALSLYKKAADFSAQSLSAGNKVRVDLSRVYEGIKPQLEAVVRKTEKKSTEKAKSATVEYLTDIKRRMGQQIPEENCKLSVASSLNAPMSTVEDKKDSTVSSGDSGPTSS